MNFTKRQEAAIVSMERLLKRFAALDLSIFVTGDVHIRRGPIEMDGGYELDGGYVKRDGVEWVTIITPGLSIDGGGW